MVSIRELYDVTKQLHEYTLNPFHKDDEEKSDAYISSVEELLEQRQAFIEQLQQVKLQVKEEEKELVAEMMNMNAVIVKKLEANKLLLGKEIGALKVKKAQEKKYNNPYDGPTAEGVFFDKRGL
ncbi:hypothetical protein BTR23_11965 [Alkalihalophilus pseudofirmus]|nr:hypothetical protein BTR23_11965 [Alkalihalophilus pseudofirmus]